MPPDQAHLAPSPSFVTCQLHVTVIMAQTLLL